HVDGVDVALEGPVDTGEHLRVATALVTVENEAHGQAGVGRHADPLAAGRPAGDGAAHVSAVAVGVVCRRAGDALAGGGALGPVDDLPLQVGMLGVDARVEHGDLHALAPGAVRTPCRQRAESLD